MSERSERQSHEPVTAGETIDERAEIAAKYLRCCAFPYPKGYDEQDCADVIDELRSDLVVANEQLRVAEAKIVGLWKLLDDIDTLDDAAGDSDLSFRDHARPIQRRRFEIVSGEEFDTLTRLNARDGGEEGSDG